MVSAISLPYTAPVNGQPGVRMAKGSGQRAAAPKANDLYYGDNLEILRRKVHDETVDLCYIDPPFNSKRNYNQTYSNVGNEDRAQAQAFIDTWVWDSHAAAGFGEIPGNAEGRFTPQLVELIKGLRGVLGAGQYKFQDMGRSYDRISIVTVAEILEEEARLDIPMSLEVLASAQRAVDSQQMALL
jgi:hypothetical protein